MMPLQNTATKVAIKPQSVATTATASGHVDTLGYEEAAVDIALDSAGATSSNPATLKLQEADVTNDSSFADITGFVGDATDGFTIPAADTASPQLVRLNLDLRKRKRYLRVVATPAGAAQLLAATVVLGKAKDSSIARGQMAEVVDG